MTSAGDLRDWNAQAAAYAAASGGSDDSTYVRFEEFLWRHLGGADLTGRSILDLGCGHGWLAAACAARGASVVGVDGSDELLAIGRDLAPSVAFHHADLTAGLPAEVEAVGFDRVVAHMVVMDLPELEALGASLRRAVQPGAVVALTLCHPSFFNQTPTEDPATGERYRKVRGYLAEETWRISSFGGHHHYHRPLEAYVQWLARHGFAVIDLVEPPVPRPTPESEWTDHDRWFRQIPTMLGLAAVAL